MNLRYLKHNEAKKINKIPLDKETMEDLILDIQDDGVDVKLVYVINNGYKWIDIDDDFQNVNRIGWMLEFGIEVESICKRYGIKNYTVNDDDINGFNEYFKVLNKIHSLINRINNHFDCLGLSIDVNPDDFKGILVIIETKPSIKDALEISYSYLKSYEDELNDYELNICEIEGDAISFTSDVKTIEEFIEIFKKFKLEVYTMSWKNITKDGDKYLVHGLAVEEIKFKC